ncbi:hypothetical protein PoB_001469400 [Plakobranchus ocellatus]|uniref:EF-hand domain-containing protein n=1 Tax=Plakobranchus ocellatus TaxID=259542 RepID=A0AAV3Z1B3_9GAST|nr:hypothetical protein PoB_001469400 [Plakobranchus ocellatus]
MRLHRIPNQPGLSAYQDTIDFDEFCRLYCKFSEAEQERKEAVASSIEKLFPTSDGQPVSLRKVENLLMKLQKPDLSMRLVREKSDLGQDDVRRLVKAMDRDGNGLISKNGKDSLVNRVTVRRQRCLWSYL